LKKGFISLASASRSILALLSTSTSSRIERLGFEQENCINNKKTLPGVNNKMKRKKNKLHVTVNFMGN
jgi:hypothetical protein